MLFGIYLCVVVPCIRTTLLSVELCFVVLSINITRKSGTQLMKLAAYCEFQK